MADRPPSGAAPRTRAEVVSEQAQQALHAGERLLHDSNAAAALPWLERACRLAPDNDTALLPYALALLALGDPRAVEPFARLAARHDVREVWLGLAAARHRLGETDAAAVALAALLTGHAVPEDAEAPGLADIIAARAGAAGWCGLRSSGAVLARPLDGRGKLEILADGARLRAGRVPQGVATLTVTCDGRHLLGSPIAVARIRRIEGFVTMRDGGLEGWAWYPGDAGRDPTLLLRAATGQGRGLRIVASDLGMAVPRPLSRPRRFVVEAARLAGIDGPVSLQGSDGRELTGSPLDPGHERRAAAAAAALVARALPVRGRAAREVPWLPTPAGVAGHPAAASRRPRRSVAVVVPAYRGSEMTLACLAAVRATAPARTTVIVVDDASPEPALSAALDDLARRRLIVLHRHAANQGFPAAVNAGLRLAAGLAGRPDIVLLNSDTIPAEGWLATLRAAVHGAGDIGTAAPLSNDASILTYPDPAAPAPAPAGADLAALGNLAARTHGVASVDIPTSVGFCMYIRRECLNATGLLRTDVFGQGYGEENDFCLRARHLGWRHVAVPGAYVAHLSGQSFGDARAHLLARNLDVLERLHPGYGALIAGWQATDPLAEARRALDAARWAGRPGRSAARGKRAAARPVVIVTHDGGGGVERAVRERCAALRAQGRGTILLRPVVDRSGGEESLSRRYLPGLCAVGEGPDGGFPNLRFKLPEAFDALAALLRAERPAWLEVHHLHGHDHSIVGLSAALRIPYEVRVHDYAWICARINLVGTDRRYCGEPDVGACVACIADAGSALEESIAPAALRHRSAGDLARARLVTVPSRDTAARLRRHFPALSMDVAPHETDTDLPPLREIPPGPRRVAVIGAIGIAKGYEALLACARDAAARDLALSFIVVGHTEDDDRLLATGRVFVTGPYLESEAVALIRRHAAQLAWLPSVWPETWCYALGEALRAGLPVVAFDLGAQAERLRATGRGMLLPLGLPAAAINNALLALRTHAGDEYAPPVENSANNLRSITARS